MKVSITFLFMATVLSLSGTILLAQDITSTLSGNTSSEGFIIVNSQGDTLLRVNGLGNVGIGTAQPNEKFEVIGRIKDKTGYVVPVGTVVPYAGNTAPDGWLMCDGSGLSTTDYDELFAVIGTTYGGGGGTFNLPDMRQKFPMGQASSGTGSVLGETGGVIDHNHTYNQVIEHTHTGQAQQLSNPSFSTSINGLHQHSFISHLGGFGYAHGGHTASFDSFEYGTSANGDHYHTIDIQHTHNLTISNPPGSVTTGTTGNSNAPYLVLNYVIKY